MRLLHSRRQGAACTRCSGCLFSVSCMLHLLRQHSAMLQHAESQSPSNPTACSTAVQRDCSVTRQGLSLADSVGHATTGMPATCQGCQLLRPATMQGLVHLAHCSLPRRCCAACWICHTHQSQTCSLMPFFASRQMPSRVDLQLRRTACHFMAWNSTAANNLCSTKDGVPVFV